MYFNIQLYLITPLFHISIWKNLRHFCRAFTLRQCQLPSTSSLWNGRGMQKREKGSLVILTSQNATISKLQRSWISSGLLNIIRKIALLGCWWTCTQTEEVLSGVKTQNNPFPHHSICACDIQTHEKHMQRRKRGEMLSHCNATNIHNTVTNKNARVLGFAAFVAWHGCHSCQPIDVSK